MGDLSWSSVLLEKSDDGSKVWRKRPFKICIVHLSGRGADHAGMPARLMLHINRWRSLTEGARGLCLEYPPAISLAPPISLCPSHRSSSGSRFPGVPGICLRQAHSQSLVR
jgi:hypothetical protein